MGRMQSQVLAEMAATEAGQQRYVRALLLNPADEQALLRLREIEARMEALRLEYAALATPGVTTK